MAKKLKRFALFAAVLAVILLPITYLTIANSEAFRTSDTFLRTDAQVRTEMGRVQDVGFVLLGDQSIAGIGGSDGHASLELWIKGTNQSGNAKLHLEKSNGVWRIIDGELMPNGGPPVKLFRHAE